MVNLDNQRPGDVWLLDRTRYEVESVEREGTGVLLVCNRTTADGGTERAVIVIISGPQPLPPAVENLRTPSVAATAPMISGGPPVTAEDDIAEGGF